jgi:hypothetical protein
MSNCNDKQATLTERANALVAKLSDESKTLAADIQEKAKGIDPDIDTTGPDVWVGLDIDISWKRVEFSLDLPEVKMVDQKWSLDLPQVTMKDQSIIFHTPSVRMKTVKTGEYPEATCRMVTKDIGFGVKIDVPECTVRWSPIYIDIPEPFMEEQKIVLGIPEFRMDRTEFVLGVPEFSMKTQKFALDLPQFTVKNINVEAKKAKAKGDDLAQEANTRAAKLKENFKENAKVELGTDVTSLFDCYHRELMERKNEAMQRFESGVNLIQSTITAMVASKIPDDDASLVSVKQGLAALIAKRDEFARVIEQKFIELGAQQKSFFDKLIGGV